MTKTVNRTIEDNGTAKAPPETEQQRQQRVLSALNQLANQNGYQIGAAAKITPEGRVVAEWGLITIG